MLFLVSLLGGGGWVALCLVADRWKARRARTMREKYRRDPLAFARDFLGTKGASPYQAELLMRLAEGHRRKMFGKAIARRRAQEAAAKERQP